MSSVEPRHSPPARVAIVIVNYRTAEQTIACLGSLAAECAGMPHSQIVVVDNASPDGSVEWLRAALQGEAGRRVRLLAQQRNGGFAAGNNAAIRELLAQTIPPDHVLLLNPDTSIRPGAIVELVRFMARHPRAGICGSQMLDEEGRSHRSAHRFPTPMNQLDAGAQLGLLTRAMGRHVESPAGGPGPRPCDWISGASMMVRRQVFEQVGQLDDRYFLYFEEVDFCRRARRRGWQVWCVPTSQVVHFEGGSTGIRQATRRPRYWFDSRRRFFRKYYGSAGLLAADVLWAAGRVSLALRRLLRLAPDNPHEPRWFMWDLLWGDCRALLAGGFDKGMEDGHRNGQPGHRHHRAE